jgi:PAS domain S-box-containing protein
MNLSTATILNVDDNDGARYAKTRILQHAGFNVIEAENGADALTQVRAKLPDLVLLDVKLPDINGIEVCRRIKAEPASAMILVLQTSAALTGRADKIRGLEGGADNYLAAPIEGDELIANVNALLRLRKTQAALRESEERFRQMAENISDVFWIFTFPNRTPLYVSNAYEKLWGRSADLLNANPDDWLHSVHPDERARVQAQFELLSKDQTYDEEFRLLQPNGSTRWVRDRAFPVMDPANEVYRVARITSDISDGKMAERILKEADSHKDEFLATLAHELRNPLGPIRNAVTLMQQVEPATSPLQTKTREIIVRQIDHLTRLVDDLLDVARISRGKIVLQKEVIDAQSFIAAAVETARPFIQARQHLFEVSVPDDKIMVLGDKVRLAQVVTNLLQNAAKYTPIGGKVSLDVQSTSNGKLRIAIQDNGIGIASDRISHMFELFAQGDTAPDRAQDGLGIGLSLVQRLLTLHEGTVSVESAGKDHGSRFTIELPTLGNQKTAVAPSTAHADTSTLSGLARPLKILVVDDNVDSLVIMELLLRELGHDVKSASDATSALAIAKEFIPDLMLLDIGLPGMDGYQLAKIVRQQPELQNAKLIAVTGYGADRDRQVAFRVGFDHHLTKPVKMDQLVELLQELTQKGGVSNPAIQHG